MLIAVTHENGSIFQHFGHTEEFKIYEIVGKDIVSTKIVPTEKEGHSALAELLKALNIKGLICGGIGQGAFNALQEKGITVFPGIFGDADEAVKLLTERKLPYNVKCTCSHHDNGHNCSDHHDHNCGSNCHDGHHGCGCHNK